MYSCKSMSILRRCVGLLLLLRSNELSFRAILLYLLAFFFLLFFLLSFKLYFFFEKFDNKLNIL
jgi:hypothetical protein